jgi:hypothetical protein
MVLVIIFLLTGIAVSTTDCQEDMGLCQGERPARPERQTPNPVRRAHAVFKQDKIHMFTMNSILSQNLYNPDE